MGYLALPMFTLLKLSGCQARSMRVSGENGAVMLDDCQRALRNEVLFDLLENVLRRVLGEVGTLSAEKQRQLAGLMRDLVRWAGGYERKGPVIMPRMGPESGPAMTRPIDPPRPPSPGYCFL